MNIFEREAKDILAFLQRQGYECYIDNDRIVAMDIVMSYDSGKYAPDKKRNQVSLYGWKDAIHFVSERE